MYTFLHMYISNVRISCVCMRTCVRAFLLFLFFLCVCIRNFISMWQSRIVTCVSVRYRMCVHVCVYTLCAYLPVYFMCIRSYIYMCMHFVDFCWLNELLQFVSTCACACICVYVCTFCELRIYVSVSSMLVFYIYIYIYMCVCVCVCVCVCEREREREREREIPCLVDISYVSFTCVCSCMFCVRMSSICVSL